MVGVFGITQPGIVFEDADPWRGEKTHLRRQLTGLLAAVLKVFGQLTVEEQDRLTYRHAVLGATKAEYVNAGLPRHLGRCAAKACHRVGKARAIHMKTQAEVAAGISYRIQLVEAIQRADFCDLGNADRSGLGKMNILALGGNLANGIRRQLALGSGGQQEFGAVGKELRGTAFVRLHVGRLGADYAVIGLA